MLKENKSECCHLPSSGDLNLICHCVSVCESVYAAELKLSGLTWSTSKRRAGQSDWIYCDPVKLNPRLLLLLHRQPGFALLNFFLIEETA